MTGFSGDIDRFFSSERGLPFNYSMQIDVGRFVTMALAFAAACAAVAASEETTQKISQPARACRAARLRRPAPLLHTTVDASFYAGADYWARITQRDSPDAGTIIGVAGVQGALSSRVSLFLEGGYGAALQKNDDDVRVTRIVGQIGVRLKF